MASTKNYTVTLSNGQEIVVNASNPQEAQEMALKVAAGGAETTTPIPQPRPVQAAQGDSSGMKSYTVTLGEGENAVKVNVMAKDKLEAQRKAVTLRYQQELPSDAPGTGRYIGLGTRAVGEGAIEGVLGLPALAADLGYNVVAGGEYLSDKVRGTPTTDNYFQFGMPVSGALSGATSKLGDIVGLPQPRTKGEKLAFAGLKGATSAVSGIAGGGGLASVMKPGMARNVIKGTTSGPKTQVAVGATAPMLTEKMLQEGYDPTSAIGTGLLYGAGFPLLGIKGAQALRYGSRPFRQGGREAMVGELLRQQATNPEAAISNLVARGQAGPRVPGSQQWSGVVSNDYGLMNLQRGFESTADAAGAAALNRANINKAQNEALLAAGVGSETAETIDAARKASRQEMDDLTYSLFDSPEVAGRLASTAPIKDKIAQIRGGRTGARSGVKSLTNTIEDMMDEAANSDGTIDPGRLYSIRQNLAEIRDGKFENPKYPGAKLAKRELGDFIGLIDGELGDITPGYAEMRALARSSASEIGAAEAGAEVYKAATGRGIPDVTGFSPISLPKLKSELANRSRNLNETQKAAIGAVIMDLEEGAKLNSATLRGVGSDTAQRISVANVIGALTGGSNTPLVKSTYGRFFGWLLDKAEPEVQQVLLDAMQDPRIAAALMRKATRGNIEYANSLLAQTLAAGTTATRATAQQQVPVEGREPTLNVNIPYDLQSLQAEMRRHPEPEYGTWLRQNFPQLVPQWNKMHGR